MSILGLLIVAILSFLVIVKAAGYAIDAIASYARRTGLSDYLIGFLIVSLGTSIPELSTAIMGSIAKSGQLVLGDVTGADILDVGLVLAITAIIGKKIKAEGKVLSRTVLMVIVMVLIPLLLGIDGVFSRIDGIILVASFVAYIIILLKREGEMGHIKKNIPFRIIWKDMLIFLGCVVAILLSARWLIFSVVQLSVILNIPLFLMGVLFMSLFTTSPELVVEIKSILKGYSGIAFGDILGSVVTNISLILGIAALINPIIFDKTSFFITGAFMLILVSIAVYLLKKKEVTWKHGIMLLSIYLVFIAVQVIREFLF